MRSIIKMTGSTVPLILRIYKNQEDPVAEAAYQKKLQEGQLV